MPISYHDVGLSDTVAVGGIEVVGEEPRAEEVSTEHCTCCGCGASKNKPFCDDRHLRVGFKDDKS